jgi:hypothetical protein
MDMYSRDDADRAEQVATFRRFTRYYMLKLQPLRDAMKGPSMHAAYMRVLRTLGEETEGVTATWIAGHLRMDRAYVRRIQGWYRAWDISRSCPIRTTGAEK